ncbi:aldehyde dehydrogenase family protein [Clostridium algidicarnis]|uniref:aldehyde dehydrogenase family protein n=1 Tax=Clostridium algidicarnis TaxID=37659 RepID=UPI001C0D227C|nr:aldehyde dehydrogenase family protein [Clostridium algidicarnis]MBU3209700.1 aldehyde dehydrogenase family protein [Clostridium algidicarnis]MBU3227052.1 aldehyde dehydrogenase family protein [Clostridium algidicarnis]MBU3250577.1 aldehyde dehydrogenase family protein [Clostridium algidicarnis]
MNIIDNDLLSMQEARILVENAREAQKRLATFPQAKLDEIVECMIEEIKKHLNELAKMSNEETEYGRWEDKYIKNHFVCKDLKNRLKGMNCVGIISDDKENMTKDVGVPMGVIIAFCPATSPVSTTIYKALIAIKSGNAIIFSPHPRAKNTTFKTMDILIRAAKEAGLPEGALAYLHTVMKSGSLELMNHKDTSLIMNTGVPEMLDEAYKSGKPVIYGGNGNGPAFIERTADISTAVKDIIESKSFDYGVVSAAEQSIVVDSCIETEVKKELQKNGGYFMTKEEAESLGKLFFFRDGSLDFDMVGKSPQFLAKRAGFSVTEDIRILISEQKFVSKVNPYSREKLSPVLAFYVENDWMHACEKCIELLLSERHGHTLVIHSKDEDVIQQFALKKPVGRVLVNTPGTFGSMGATTNLFPSMTLGSGSAGKGMTSDNVSPMNLVYIRKIGYGVRKVDEFKRSVDDTNRVIDNNEAKDKTEDFKMLERIIKEVLKELK